MSEKTIDLGLWVRERIKHDEISRYLKGSRDFIHDDEFEELLKTQHDVSGPRVRDIIAKALSIQTLTLEEVATLLNVTDEALWSLMRQAAATIKEKVYDNRIVTFAPMYIGNLCVNHCLYCGFRNGNTAITRKILTLEEIRHETEILTGRIGHKRLMLVCGEHPLSNIEYLTSAIAAVYATQTTTKNNTLAGIRRINVNAPPFSIEELTMLRRAGIGTYQVFQETYHHKTYEMLHPHASVKSNYQWRLYSMHRALEAGVDDVGIGALFGLYDWKFEVIGLCAHARELEKLFGIGPHTVSFPRLEPALNTPLALNSKYKVSDNDFKKVLTVLRLAIPYTGMILTARENSRIRRECIPLGITQTDASTKIGVGAYSHESTSQEETRQQFLLGDTRSLDEVVRELAHAGYITSFCTAGYRCQRTGKCIMELLRTGKEGKFCKLNAVLTFREWLDDFASEKTKEIAEKIINREIARIKETMPGVFEKFFQYYTRITAGERDLYF
ncbi:MAG: [FeFe] hydrogenase H-cluster radical SAM maturase HydG [Candidatus Omnitrophica bacterium]|nr:[FeFe] hydrogenase H-cluster radical SAM maturase HydG [Candidatus Omnitrophota bacterium]